METTPKVGHVGQGHPDYDRTQVLLDGVEQRHAVEADDIEGYVVRAIPDEDWCEVPAPPGGYPTINGGLKKNPDGSPLLERVTGRVQIVVAPAKRPIGFAVGQSEVIAKVAN